MKVGLCFSFIDGSIDGKLYSKLFNKYIKFTPQAFRKKHSTKPWNLTKHLIEISSAKSKDEISVYDTGGNIFTVGSAGLFSPHQTITIEQDCDMFMPSNSEINEILNSANGFTAGYLYNSDYAYVQSAKSDTLLEGKEFSSEILLSLKNTPFKIGTLDDKEYDIRFNPGRMILIEHTWLMAGWKMWFGKSFFELVPKERLLSFPHAIEVKELENEIVYVQLYEGIDKPTTPDSVFRQWKWQEWLNFDELNEKYP